MLRSCSRHAGHFETWPGPPYKKVRPTSAILRRFRCMRTLPTANQKRSFRHPAKVRYRPWNTRAGYVGEATHGQGGCAPLTAFEFERKPDRSNLELALANENHLSSISLLEWTIPLVDCSTVRHTRTVLASSACLSMLPIQIIKVNGLQSSCAILAAS